MSRSAVGLALIMVLACCSSAQAKRAPLELGLWDQVFLSGDASVRGQWLDRTVDLGADQVTIQANWRHITGGRRPTSPTDPSDPAYDWTVVDAAVRDASQRGLATMIMLQQAPDWAEGPDRDPKADPGTWRPDPEALAQFATAAARRYSGSFPDPAATGTSLPRVGTWEIWGEPNLSTHLTPQWDRNKGKWRTASPHHYRRMVNAAYAALNAVDPTNQVVAGGLALAGDYKPGSARLAPLRFWREFFCLSGRKLKPETCPGGKPHLDVLGHNPLSVYASVGPFESAPQPDDIYVPDMHKLSRVIKAARKHRRITPRRGTELWATELLAWTNPPVFHGVSQERQAKYLADALYVLWKQGVSQVFWVGIRDGDFGSGLYSNDGEAKLAAQAFRFPLVVRTKKGKHKDRVRVWGRAPADGPVQIERQSDAGWTVVKTLGTKQRIFNGLVRAGRADVLRATAGGEHSLAI